MNLLLIGAGQLGSRHLQACLKFEKKLNICVLDSSIDSLKLAEERANEINQGNKHSVVYYQDLNKIVVSNFNFLIIATGASVRLNVLRLALDNFQFEYAILEKVLFQDINSYTEASDLIIKNDIKTYVNCPLRTYPIFKSIKNELSHRNDSIIIEYTGGEWAGLACNSIHYLDLMHFLSEEMIENVNIEKLDAGYVESKRLGCIEFTGILETKFSKQSKVIVKTVRGSDADSIIMIKCGDKRWVIDELSGDYKIYNKQKIIEENTYPLIYQSDLTHKMLDQLEKTGTCELIHYHESEKIHKIFIEKLLVHFNKSTTIHKAILPIT